MSGNNERLNEALVEVLRDEKISSKVRLKKAQYMIALGADVNAKFFGKSILRWLKKDEDVAPEVIEFLKEKGAKEFEISKEEADKLSQGFWDENGEIRSLAEIKNLVRLGAGLSGYNKNTKEQIWSDLSLQEMNEILKILPKGYEIEGDVNLSKCGLKKLPDFSKIKIKGDFNCRSNQLISLEGAPRIVDGNFSCSLNDNISLKGAPRVVGGDFNCSYSCLKSLEGAPREVGGDFVCDTNELISLEGAPREVGGDFICSSNQFTSLKGAPKDVGSGFVCSYNQLTTLEGAPRYVAGGFDCSHNQLTTLEGAPSEVGGNFDCCSNQLTTLEGKPQIIGYGFKIEEEVLAKIEENEKKQKAKLDVNLYVGNEGR